MVTMANSFVIPDEVVNMMRKKVEETKEKSVELGFGLCRLPNNVIKTGEECIGDKCTLLPKETCVTGSYVGEFHTHPTASTNPSIADLLHAYRNEAICVGSAPEDKIKCFIRAGSKDPIIQKKLEEEEIIEGEKFISKKRTVGDVLEWVGVRNALMKKYFNVIDVK